MVAPSSQALSGTVWRMRMRCSEASTLARVLDIILRSGHIPVKLSLRSLKTGDLRVNMDVADAGTGVYTQTVISRIKNLVDVRGVMSSAPTDGGN